MQIFQHICVRTTARCCFLCSSFDVGHKLNQTLHVQRVVQGCYCSFFHCKKHLPSSSFIYSAGLFGYRIFPQPRDPVEIAHHSVFIGPPVLSCSCWSSQLQRLPFNRAFRFLWLSSTKRPSGFEHKRVRESVATEGRSIGASVLRGPSRDCSSSVSGGRTSILSVPLATIQHSRRHCDKQEITSDEKK